MYCLIRAVLRFRQDADKIVDGQRLQFDTNRKSALQFGNQVGRLADMKRTGGNEQNVVGTNHAVASVHRGAFHDRQNVALHAFAADVRSVPGFASGNLVDLVEKDDAVLFDALDGDPRHLVHVDKLLLFFLDQVVDRLGDFHLPLLGALAEESGQDVLEVDVHLLDALSWR